MIEPSLHQGLFFSNGFWRCSDKHHSAHFRCTHTMWLYITPTYLPADTMRRCRATESSFAAPTYRHVTPPRSCPPAHHPTLARCGTSTEMALATPRILLRSRGQIGPCRAEGKARGRDAARSSMQGTPFLMLIMMMMILTPAWSIRG